MPMDRVDHVYFVGNGEGVEMIITNDDTGAETKAALSWDDTRDILLALQFLVGTHTSIKNSKLLH